MDGWSLSGPRFLGGMEVSVRRRCRVEIKKRNQKTTRRQLTISSVAKVSRYMAPRPREAKILIFHSLEQKNVVAFLLKEIGAVIISLGPTNHLVVEQLIKSNLLHIKQDWGREGNLNTASFGWSDIS